MRWQEAQIQQAERDRKAQEAALKVAEREARKRYLTARRLEAEKRTARIEGWTALLGEILTRGIRRSAAIDLRRYRRNTVAAAFDPGVLGHAAPRPTWEQFEPPPPGLLTTRRKRQAERDLAERQFTQADAAWTANEQRRQAALVAAEAEHRRKTAEDVATAKAHNRRLDEEMTAISARDRESVRRYLEEVLKAIPLPKGFPRRVDVAYSSDSEQAVVQMQLPSPDVVPTVKAVRYVQNSDKFQDIARNAREVADTYRDVVAQVALLAVRDIFDADPKITDVAFNGHVDTTDPATGRAAYPCVLSLEVNRAEFDELVLDKVSPADCLRHLNALVSPHPYALTPIEPVLNFDLSKYAFVQGLDAVSTLDHRPDLMDMGHGEFEHLVRQIFEAMGMQGWTTTASKDDGVDAVVVNPKPFVGGLTIIQAKHYKSVVGVNHIRELAGAMEEKKAGRGILVTTSWFTPGGHIKAREHGRMELVDGPILVHLIKEHLGKDVLIGIRRPKNSSPPAPVPGAP
jgi:restriction system protein